MSAYEDFKTALRKLQKRILAHRLIFALMLIAAAIEAYNTTVIPALVNREKAANAEAVAENSRLRQQAEAETAEAKALTATAVADNAPRKEAADARRAKAAALHTAAAAEFAAATADTSDVKSAAEADAQTAAARIAEQQATVEREGARQSSRLTRAKMESEQIRLAVSRITTMMRTQNIQFCTDCDPSHCILCTKRYVPDLPSGAILPPPEDGEPALPNPPRPKLNVLVTRLPWQAGSQCDKMWNTWKATLAYGAYASGPRSGCDYVAGAPDPATARRNAIARCYSHYGASNCQIIAEITTDEPPKPPKQLPPGTPQAAVVDRTFAITGNCAVLLANWKKQHHFGAFAAGSAHCGAIHSQPDIETARREALARCNDRDCRIAYTLSTAPAAPATTPIPAAPLPPGQTKGQRATVVPPLLNVHSIPSPDAQSVVARLNRGQTVTITGTTENDFVAIEATCSDGQSCKGYVNGRAEFLQR